MAQKTSGLSRELIIHPGETLCEVLDDRGMTQRELALRSGVTEKHVSTIVKGTKPISVAYARNLEYALGISSGFWINLQGNYDREIMEFEEVNNISVDEIAVLKPLKPVIEYLGKKKILSMDQHDAMRVIELRKFLSISNLTDIPNFTYNAAYRAQTTSSTDVYVLYAWQKICEAMTSDMEVAEGADLGTLKGGTQEIKKLMFTEPNTIRRELNSFFAGCGIAFEVVKHFPGAPVQGFIKKNETGRLILCLTIRQGYADRFWFTLFHEIAHVIHGDVKQKFVDFDSVENEVEEKANRFARNELLSPKEYKQFIQKNDFSLRSIEEFSETQNVRSFIVIGRLKKEEILDWKSYPAQMVIYKWADR